MTEAAVDDDAPRTKLDPDELAALEEERDFLLRSIADLEREHEAGDIDEADYAALSDGYTARTAEVLRAIAEQRSAFTDTSGRMSRGRLVLVVVAVLVVGALAGVLVSQASGRRQQGDTITGAGVVPKTPTQEAQGCVGLSTTKPTEAIDCFKGVLDKDPKNPTALAYLGWTLVLASGSLDAKTGASAVKAGAGFIDKAIESDPTFPDAYAFAAIVAFRSGDVAGAKKDLDTLDSLDPPAGVKALTSSLRDQVEKALREGTTTTTAPPSTTTTTGR